MSGVVRKLKPRMVDAILSAKLEPEGRTQPSKRRCLCTQLERLQAAPDDYRLATHGHACIRRAELVGNSKRATHQRPLCIATHTLTIRGRTSAVCDTSSCAATACKQATALAGSRKGGSRLRASEVVENEEARAGAQPLQLRPHVGVPGAADIELLPGPAEACRRSHSQVSFNHFRIESGHSEQKLPRSFCESGSFCDWIRQKERLPSHPGWLPVVPKHRDGTNGNS